MVQVSAIITTRCFAGSGGGRQAYNRTTLAWPTLPFSYLNRRLSPLNGYTASRRHFLFMGMMTGICSCSFAPDEDVADRRLVELLGRPPAEPEPIGLYAASRRVGHLLYLSTTVARQNGQPKYQGLVGRDLDLREGAQAARASALSLLETVHHELGSLRRVRQVVNIIGYVASAETFYMQADVMNGASEVLIEVLGNERGKSSRSAVGVTALSRNATVAISGVVEFR